MPQDNLSDITPVVLCGGSGRRLRPLSRAGNPKPFLKVNGRRTMLQQTVLRMRGCAAPILILNRAMAGRAYADLSAVSVAAGGMILEPAGRNTAPALAAAASVLPSSLMLILPADHWVQTPEALLSAVARAVPLARDGWMVSFGMTPTRAESGFGYIRRGAVVHDGIYRIDRFIEKPPHAVARSLIRSGTCDWNSGMFLVSAETALAELRRFEPGLLCAVQKSVLAAEQDREAVFLGPQFADAPSMSIDVAIMERSDKTLVVPVETGWDDLGTWPGLLRRAFS